MTRRNIWNQREVSVRNDFKSYAKDLTENNNADVFVGALGKATDIIGKVINV